MKDEIASKKLSRRQLLKAGAVGAALPLFSILTRPANAAEFTYKFATGQDPSHPVNKRAQEANTQAQSQGAMSTYYRAWAACMQGRGYSIQ